MAKAHTFTEEDVELLRRFARELMSERGLTTIQLGEILELGQQRASAFTTAGSIARIGRPAANALARHVGLPHCESLLQELRARWGAEGVAVGNVWGERDSAARVALALEYDARAIERVKDRFKDDQSAAKRPKKWWLEQFAQEERWLEAKGGESRP